MDPSDEPPDDLRVRLKWPGMPDTSLEPTDESSEVTDAEVDYPHPDTDDPAEGEAAQASGRQAITTQQLILAGRSDSLQAALASIALRIDALTSTTSTFRNLVSDRLTDYADQVGRMAAGAAGDLDDYRHLHERSLEQIRRSVADAEENLRKLSRTVGDLELKTVALVAAVRENGDAVDHLLSERDHVSDTLLRSLDRVGLQVQAGLEQGLATTTASMARLEDAVAEMSTSGVGQSVERLDLIVEALSVERDRQLAISAQLEDGVSALAGDHERDADAIGRLERAITAVTATQERSLSKLASRIDARMDQVAGALEGVAGDDLVAILTRLDARLKELSTEVVAGRDRETARGLAQLAGQIDGVAGMIADDRAARQPLEARLTRLSPAAPDLSELYARFDELAHLVARYQPPDLQEVHAHLDELIGQQLGAQIEALRRRIALRARPAALELDSQAIAAIAEAVVARLGATEPPDLAPPPKPLPPRRPGPVSVEQRRRGSR